ncbi:uncharacterized protein ZSWIM9 [Bombina bombina]|uniref:uncharacterized protein ZSWIM9 n=1 Tax=Bombina bombina TaxID=8345 RepID=UPI00235A6DC5|nr:uncharacterized protein ZSWIM9 [Bombina bombina]
MDELGLGQEFLTWQQFSTFFDDWSERHKVLFIIASLKPLLSFRKNPLPHAKNLAKTLRFRFVRLICKHSGTYAGQSIVRRNQNQEKIDCPASITLRLHPKRDRLVVIEANIFHNHNLSAVEFSHYFKRHQLEASMGLPIRITNNVSKRFLAPDIVWNLEEYSKAKDQGMCDLLKEFDILFKNDPMAKVKLVFQEDAAVINSIFISTSHMGNLVQSFPRILYMGNVLHVNEEFELYTVLCQDANGRGRECAYCIARKGTPDLLVFIVASLVQSVPTIKFKVKCITVGANIPDGVSLNDVLPCTKIQICRSQVLENLHSKARELGTPKTEKIQTLLYNMAYSDSAKTYAQCLNELENVCSVNFFQYYLEKWHQNKSMWVACWAFDRKRKCCFMDHMNFHIQKLNSILLPPVTLSVCMRELLHLEVLKTGITDVNQENIAVLYHSVCSAESASQIEEELSLARQSTLDIKETDNGFLVGGGSCSFTVNKEITSCSCCIYTTTVLPCRHLFAVRLWSGKSLFDAGLIQHQPIKTLD